MEHAVFISRKEISLAAAVLLFLTAISLCYGDPEDLCDRGLPIVALEVVGNRSYNQLMILNASGIEIERACSRDLIRDAVLKLHHLHLFSEVRIEVAREGGGVKLVITVAEKPKLNDIRIEGNRKIKTDEILERITLISGSLYDEFRCFEDSQSILSLYHEKGYLNATVTHRLEEPDESDRVAAVFEIDESQKVKIRGITFADNSVYTDRKLGKLMRTKPKKWYRSGDFHEDHFEEDLEKIKAFYRNHGYIDVVIEDHSFSYDEARKGMYIDIVLDEGEQYRLGTITWEGNENISDEGIKEALRLRENRVFDQGRYDESIMNIYFDYSEIGYIYANVVPERSVSDNVIDVHVRIRENFPAHVRRINVSGNTKTKEKVIRREMLIYPGEIFKRSRLVRSQQNIFNLGFFEDVQMATPPSDDEGNINLDFQVKEKFSGQFNTAIGYSAIDKLTGTIGISHPNVLGNGWRADINWEFGAITQNLVLGFTEPWLFDTPTLFGVDLYHRSRNLTDYEEKRVGGALRLARPVPGVAFTRVYSSLRTEDVDIWYDEEPSYTFAMYYPEGKRRTISTLWTIVRDSRDNIFFTSDGSVSKFSAEFAGGLLGGEVNYQKYTASTKWYIPTFWKLSLMVGAEGGIIDGYSSPSEVPLYEKFFMGGVWDTNLRGYPDRSIGPMDEDGRMLGGRTMMKMSLEYVFPIVQNQISGLFFYEAGNIWDNLVEVDPSDLNRGAGLGIRLQVPMVGMIGFDYGYGFDRPWGGAWEPHFQFGTTFY